VFILFNSTYKFNNKPALYALTTGVLQRIRGGEHQPSSKEGGRKHQVTACYTHAIILCLFSLCEKDKMPHRNPLSYEKLHVLYLFRTHVTLNICLLWNELVLVVGRLCSSGRFVGVMKCFSTCVILFQTLQNTFVESWLDERGHSLVPLSNPGSDPEVSLGSGGHGTLLGR